MSDRRFRPKKRFGQNFLQDRGIAAKIVGAAGLGPGDTVVELGPGHGVLTRLIAGTGARVVALELDRDLAAELQAEFGTQADGTADRGAVDVRCVDFTTVSLGELLGERGIDRCVLIGNIPYHLTRNVLFDFLVSETGRIARSVVMMQREVGERIASPPGSRVYGITSVVLQSLYDIRVVTKVAPGSFHPRPRVASIVLGFHPLTTPFLESAEVGPFVALVKNLFQQRRKTIHNTLRAFYSLPEPVLEHAAAQSGVDLGSRPEVLTREQFRALSRALTAAGS
ncbi:MAG TPA: 16S rRNA (adenine(1518)-N(6)/adenine(1519)-N(6))-dimethyltransferase RsmA [Candidatus Krumholzibacteria bacterium]|nr:16S rRNA (adenine(1518)-N(6)/adenine(1519)-N(6))-dimethyltransferase RsmA [Candidatus Krumholzibacteria bacterium]